MWWDYQNLNKPRTDKTGMKWNIRVWHEVISQGHVARIFFWNEKRDFTGVVLYPPAANTHISRLRAVIQKLIADPQLRAKNQREISFPLESHYSEYGAFPEESGNP